MTETPEEKNAREHEGLHALFNKGELRFVTAFERLEGKVAGYRLAVVVGWFITVGLGGLLLQAHLSKLSDVADTVKETARVVAGVDKRQEAWEKFANGWGGKLEEADDRIDDDIDEIRDDVKQLRRQTRQKE